MASNPSSLSVVQVKYGERMVRKSSVFHDYGSYGLPDGELHMEYNFWVLRDDSRVLLMDTGYEIEKHDWLGEQPVKDTRDGLTLLGIDPAEVSMVITSHFHYDHIGYLKLFENAEVVSGQAEYDYWFGKMERDELEGEFTTAEDLVPVKEAADEGRLRLVAEETTVYPGITVYPVGGHCPGEILAKVDTRTNSLILAADAAHFYEQVEHEWPFFAFTSLDEMRAGLSFINRLSADTGATVIPGHDSRTRDRFPALEGPAFDIATVLG